MFFDRVFRVGLKLWGLGCRVSDDGWELDAWPSLGKNATFGVP